MAKICVDTSKKTKLSVYLFAMTPFWYHHFDITPRLYPYTLWTPYYNVIC